jgi:phosphatidylserine/phosphatidylglycerophosphate/cardiolipin synthase-like enzyme
MPTGLSFRQGQDTGWEKELRSALLIDATTLRIICPFIKSGVLKRLLDVRHLGATQVIRFNLSDFAEGVSDITALRLFLDRAAQVRGVRNLHSKLYLFGSSRAVVTSANLTEAALSQNHELGFVSEDASIIAKCRAYFEDLWARSGNDLTVDQIEAWDKEVAHYLARGIPPGQACRLNDYGENAGMAEVMLGRRS